MANVSFSIVQGSEYQANDQTDVTEGSAAPGTGDLEIRFDATKFTVLSLNEALEKIWRFAADVLQSTSTPAV